MNSLRGGGEDVLAPARRDLLKERLHRGWFKFSRSRLSVLGLGIVTATIMMAVLAPVVAPHPSSAGVFVDFSHASQAPSLHYLLGTDTEGRDVLSRIIFAFRGALRMGVVVLAIAVPVGVFLGLLAGYYRGRWIDSVIMRITDVFVALPPLILALAITAVLQPNMTNAMLAITVVWWPWYTRLVYGMASSLRNEYFVVNAGLVGASSARIIVRELLPNCLSPVFTKAALDMGWVTLVAAALGFVGLGEQPPTPGLGQMVADGVGYMPQLWWMTVFPSLGIILFILGFNLLGDGVRDLLSSER